MAASGRPAFGFPLGGARAACGYKDGMLELLKTLVALWTQLLQHDALPLGWGAMFGGLLAYWGSRR